MGHASRSNGLLRVKASRARVSQSGRRRDGGWCTWHHRGGCVESTLKMDGSMRRTALDPSTPESSFFRY
jgi:hypothetical protein